ncbi:MAG: hypothetical protein P1U56_11630 [Saprospiraceae bacterium]|nr:hypothetical protein [Saprospiraceae bacterium]
MDLIALDNSSKVWIYQANREFTYEELDIAREYIFHFLNDWTAHNNELTSYGNIFHKRFLALFVDESNAGVSGCGIDKSVKFVEFLGKKMNVDFFDRMTHAYMKDEEIFTISHQELPIAYAQKHINDHTLFFDNLVKTKGEFLDSWIKPLKNSWHTRFL